MTFTPAAMAAAVSSFDFTCNKEMKKYFTIWALGLFINDVTQVWKRGLNILRHQVGWPRVKQAILCDIGWRGSENLQMSVTSLSDDQFAG